MNSFSFSHPRHPSERHEVRFFLYRVPITYNYHFNYKINIRKKRVSDRQAAGSKIEAVTHTA